MKHIVISAFIGLALSAQAQAMSATQSVLKEIRSVDPTGQVQLRYVTADLVTPGEVVVYRVDYQNDGTDPVTDFELTMPVPPQIRFSDVIDAAPSQTIVYSADGAESFHSLSDIVTRTDAGEIVPAQPEEITHIRWTMNGSMPTGAAGHVAFRGVLE